MDGYSLILGDGRIERERESLLSQKVSRSTRPSALTSVSLRKSCNRIGIYS